MPPRPSQIVSDSCFNFTQRKENLLGRLSDTNVPGLPIVNVRVVSYSIAGITHSVGRRPDSHVMNQRILPAEKAVRCDV